VHPHDLAIDERIHDGCLSTGLIFFAVDGGPIPTPRTDMTT
jgi:hypothetical protein